MTAYACPGCGRQVRVAGGGRLLGGAGECSAPANTFLRGKSRGE
jgi:hypothetical protein